MAGKKLTVVISQHQGKNPAKRKLEEDLAMACMLNPEVDVSIVPNLYDLGHDHSGMLFLKGLPGDVFVLGWLYPRAIRWTLDRAGVKGKTGTVLIESEDDEDNEPENEADVTGIGALNVPNRFIYCADLKASTSPQVYLDEINRIVSESKVRTVDLMSWIQGDPNKDQLQRYLNPTAVLQPSAPTNGHSVADADDGVKRRWYPVIDYSRCTNCMECIDFCLFGVYGVDVLDRILVETQDNCKKGCPACSRVCPANAIIFPQHKQPEIAGASGEVTSLKIDLSQLFGAPDPLELAARERDIELVRDGRDAVGMSVGIKKRQTQCGPRDELDDLIDGLDQLDL